MGSSRLHTLELPSRSSHEDPISAISDQGDEQTAIEHDLNIYEIPTRDSGLSKDLWEHAYDILKRREPELVASYNDHLTVIASKSEHTSLQPEIIETVVRSQLQDREAKQLVIRLGKQPIKVREQCERVTKFILWSKDIVSQALSAQPYAALAWSGVSILLPVGIPLIRNWASTWLNRATVVAKFVPAKSCHD